MPAPSDLDPAHAFKSARKMTAEEIRSIRQALGWSLAEMGEALDRTRNMIFNYEHEESPVPPMVALGARRLAVSYLMPDDKRRLRDLRTAHQLAFEIVGGWVHPDTEGGIPDDPMGALYEVLREHGSTGRTGLPDDEIMLIALGVNAAVQYAREE